MKILIYIGNIHNPASVMEQHGTLLEKHFRVFYASGKKHKLLRLLDMVATLLRRQGEASTVIIAVYSTLNFYYAWLIALLCRWLRKPYIAYLHGGNLPARIKRSPWKSQAVFLHSFANVAPSDYLQSAFERAGFAAKTIPNFIQINHYPCRHRKKLRPRLLWVRAFEKTYHPEMAIQVLGELKKTFPNAELCMVGPDKDGSLGLCRALALQLDVERDICFAGELPRAEWIAMADGFDIFLNTTRADNTPVSIIEAMALGFPIVSTDVGGIPFLIEHAKDGLLSPNADVPAMVGNILRLLHSPELSARLSENARKKAEAFDWEIVERQWLELFRPLP